MTIGPLLMGLGLLWLARMPADSAPWLLRVGESETLLPPTDHFVDVLPAMVLFGIGVAVMVAPLTTALMRSVPARQAGLASAINNAVSRVGPQLCGAIIFIIITASFYSSLQARQPELDTSSPEVRHQIAPLNRPAEGVPADQAASAQAASVEAFHLAMMASAGLLFAGALVNWAGIRDDQALQRDRTATGEVAGEAPPETTGALG
jgi:hypothetical protein